MRGCCWVSRGSIRRVNLSSSYLFFDIHAERPLKNTWMHSWYHVSSAEWSSPIREHDVILNARMKEFVYNKYKIPADETHPGSHGWSDRRDIGQRVSLLLLILEFGMCRCTFLHNGAAYLCLRVAGVVWLKIKTWAHLQSHR